MLASSVRHGLQLWCLVDFINLKATTPKINLAQTVEEKETTRSTMHRSCTKNQQNCTESFCCKNEIQLACCFIFFTELILIAVPQLGTKIIYGSLFRVEEKEGLMMHNFISTFFLLKFILSVHIDFSLFAWKKNINSGVLASRKTLIRKDILCRSVLHIAGCTGCWQK